MESGYAGTIATSGMGTSIQGGSENQHLEVASTTASVLPAAATEASKTSVMSVVGPNFVIPKNKALVPVTRTTKWEPLEPKKEEPQHLSRKTKWGPDLTEEPAVKRGRALAYQTRAEQLAAQLESNNLEIDNNESTRSPSPPPIYDSMGHRMNTREGRKRDRLDMERREAIGECMKLNPFYKPPSGFRPVLKEAKCFIPAKDNPGYNFIGLILGPRGLTQKRLEAETGCRITIRGKGSIKDGKSLPYRHGKDNDGTSEELHVHIAAETWEKVDAAVAIVEPLLIPVDEDRNIYKMKQLRELAEMNGTVRDFIRICTLCGEEGHREWQCPKDKLQTFQAKVICRLCGDGSHPTMDCPLKLSGQGKAIDKEYLSFLEELGAGLGGIDPPAKSDSDNCAGGPLADTSQPMLLTASGAQPISAKWMDGFNDFNRRMAAGGGSEAGAFPRFPFPFPFPPPGPQAMRFLPPFLNPAFLEMFKGRPVPPPLQMMAIMLSAFRGRFPFPPPFGFRPDMMRPPIPPASTPEGPPPPPMPPSLTPECPPLPPPMPMEDLPFLPMDVPTLGQGHTADMVVEGGAAQTSSDGCPPFHGMSNEYEQQHANVGLSVAVPPSPVLNNSFSLETKPRSPPLRAFASVRPTSADLPPSVLPVSPVAPAPTLPSVRPLPSIRPVIPPVLPPPPFTPLGGPAFTPASLGVGISNINNSPSLDSQCMPPQAWNSWSQGQSSSTSELEKPASDFTSSSVFSTPGTLTPMLTRAGSPYSNVGESRTYFSAPDSPSYPSLHPPSLPMNLGPYPPRPVPLGALTMPPSFISNPLQPLPSQFGMAGDIQSNNRALSYSDSRFGPSFPMGPLFRPGGSANVAPALDGYRSFTPLSQRLDSALSIPAAPMTHPAHAFQHGSSFPPSELPYSRVHEPLHAATSSIDLHSHGSNRSADEYHSGGKAPSASYFDQESRGIASESFERNYRYEPSIPPHMLQQNLQSPWSTNLLSKSRPGVEQASWGQQEMGGGSWLNSNVQNAASRQSSQEGDPEYEKLMSSVGVL